MNQSILHKVNPSTEIGADRKRELEASLNLLTCRDGPPLRALALIPYAHYILDRNHLLDVQYVEESLYDPTSLRSPGSVIKNDLEEIAHGWQKEGFDLWEEVYVYLYPV